tara:strand:- start:4933 stop:5292 length:360 start_codon:yes stop_codon:yes gene_type:complete
MLASCLDFGGGNSNSSVNVGGHRASNSSKTKSKISLPSDGIVDYRTFLKVDISKNMKESDHLNITTREGRILFSGSVHSLRSKAGIEIPRKLESVLVSTVSGANRKLIKVSSNSIKVGY